MFGRGPRAFEGPEAKKAVEELDLKSGKDTFSDLGIFLCLSDIGIG